MKKALKSGHAVAIIVCCAFALAVGFSGTVTGSLSAMDELRAAADETATLNPAQAILLEDPAVDDFLTDEAFQGPEWKALTAVNGWDVKRLQRQQTIRDAAANVIFPGFTAEARQLRDAAINRDLPTEEEFPVFEALLDESTSACTAGDETPAEYIDGRTPVAAAIHLDFYPRTPGQQDVALNAYRAAVTAGVKHLCPEK